MNNKKKVLLMGRSCSGKTSMRSIIFANYVARNTQRLAATMNVEHSHVRFLGNLALNLWDCGGQKRFMDDYLNSQRNHIFQDVSVLIYVFDAGRDLEEDIEHFKSCIEAITENSSKAKVFSLIHKMDLIPVEQRDQLFKERSAILQEIVGDLELVCFPTSIWDETLYRAWSSIVYALIPNISVIEDRLQKFCKICEADEVVLFESATFLVISHANTKSHDDIHRFEKISNIIKHFKLSCSKSGAHFQHMEVRNSRFSAFIELFTGNTFVMVIMSDPAIKASATQLNIKLARSHFTRYLLQTVERSPN
eukprot:TRINITY_DN6948_c0_g1_i1.p1 TRINITY_DN6948_c0_g1~~TRINITY_DN6948_c0_g1_i1.p1  ORF type:complete len:317 (-),score=37.80 TRINITY_DN6948_c0_g1_i1:8-928(-)